MGFKNYPSQSSPNQKIVFFSTLFLIFIGISLRLKHYFENRSLWLDEAYVALGVSRQSFEQILNFHPIAADLPLPPFGFLLIEKFLITILGNNEYVLRLFPLIAGIVSIILFYQFIKKYFSPTITTLLLAVFVLANPLIYYSAEVKQYSSDLLFSLILLLTGRHYKNRKRFTKLDSLIFGLVGSGAIFCSFPSVFILTAFGGYFLFLSIMYKNWDRLRFICMAGGFWLISFVYIYTQCIEAQLGKNVLLKGAKEHGYLLSTSIFSQEGLIWLCKEVAGIFESPLGIYPSIFGLFIFICGVFYCFRLKRDEAWLLMPLILTLLVALFGKYLFGDRFLIFLTPVILFFIGEGLTGLSKIVPRYQNVISVFLVGALLFIPLKQNNFYLKYSFEKENVRDVLQFLFKNRRSSDAIYFKVIS